MNVDALHWKDKKVCFLGDSITEGVGCKRDRVYWRVLAEKIGINAFGYGVNGAKFGELLSQAEKMKEERGNDVDAIFVFAGTNDFRRCKPMGEWYSVTEKSVLKDLTSLGPENTETRKVRTFIYGTDTFRGSVNTVLSFLKTNYPDKQIVLMTPIHRAYSVFGLQNVQYDELHSNSDGLFIEDYIASVKEAANIWSTELIDLNSASGLFPLFDKSAKLFYAGENDRLHPNESGHARIAEVIAKKLTAIPVF